MGAWGRDHLLIMEEKEGALGGRAGRLFWRWLRWLVVGKGEVWGRGGSLALSGSQEPGAAEPWTGLFLPCFPLPGLSLSLELLWQLLRNPFP